MPQEASHVQRAFPEFHRHFMQKERRLGQRTQGGREETSYIPALISYLTLV